MTELGLGQSLWQRRRLSQSRHLPLVGATIVSVAVFEVEGLAAAGHKFSNSAKHQAPDIKGIERSATTDLIRLLLVLAVPATNIPFLVDHLAGHLEGMLP